MSEQTTAVPTVTGYHHMGLTVGDVDRSEAWYGEVFGFQRVFVEPHNEGTGYAVVMNIPGTPLFLGLDKHDAHAGEPFAEHRTGLDHLAIGVAAREDLDRWVEHLDALGVEHSKINDLSEPFPAATLCFRDLDNIALELMWM
jgi:catechol 2,3-dioxygenase-like lactoylglutathione lyase family enzyme